MEILELKTKEEINKGIKTLTKSAINSKQWTIIFIVIIFITWISFLALNTLLSSTMVIMIGIFTIISFQNHNALCADVYYLELKKMLRGEKNV